MPIPLDTSEFISRWRDKRHRYNSASLEDVFDRFFTSYVLYNFLYELVTVRENYNVAGDQEAAIQAVRNYLGNDELFADDILRRSARSIVTLIEDRTFYIRDFGWDRQRVTKLKTNDPSQWAKGLLEVIYKIRCNTFHGQKRFEPSQRMILEPCIEALDRLNDLTISRLEA